MTDEEKHEEEPDLRRPDEAVKYLEPHKDDADAVRGGHGRDGIKYWWVGGLRREWAMLKREVSLYVGGRGLIGRSRRRGWRAVVFSVAAGLSALWALALAGSAAAAPTTVAFTTQGCTTWTVPAGVSSVQIQATGAAGGGGGTLGPLVGGVGGTGDGVSGSLSGLASGSQILDVCVDQGGGAGSGTVTRGGDGGGASGASLGSDFSSPVL